MVDKENDISNSLVPHKDLEEILKEIFQKIRNEKYPNLKYLIENWNDKTPQHQQTQILEQVQRYNVLENNFLNYQISRAYRHQDKNKQIVNPFNEFVPPSSTYDNIFTTFDDKYDIAERNGLRVLADTCIIINAVSIGHHLDFPRPLMLLSINSQTKKSLLQMQIEHILQLQERCSQEVKKNVKIPVYFVLSEQTQTDIMDLLHQNELFGLESVQMKIFKQKNVPRFQGNQILEDEKDKNKFTPSVNQIKQLVYDSKSFKFHTEFHGKGGLHFTLRDQEIERRPANQEFLQGKEYTVILSDDNYLQLNCLLHMLGTLKQKNLSAVFPSVAKMPKENMKVLLKKEQSNADFVNEQGTVDWSQVFFPVASKKMWHVGYDFNFDSKSNFEFFKEKVKPDIEHEYKNTLKHFHAKHKENEEDAEKRVMEQMKVEKEMADKIKRKTEELTSKYKQCHRLLNTICIKTKDQYNAIYGEKGEKSPHEQINLQFTQINLNPPVENEPEIFSNRKKYDKKEPLDKRKLMDDIQFGKKSEAIEEARKLDYGNLPEEIKENKKEMSKSLKAISQKMSAEQAVKWHLHAKFLDVVETLESDCKLEVLVYPRWFCLNSFKYSLQAAQARMELKLSPKCLSTSEMELYYCQYNILKEMKVQIPESSFIEHRGVKHIEVPQVYLSPKFQNTIKELRTRLNMKSLFDKPNIKVSSKSMLHLDGNITIKSLVLDGAMSVVVGMRGSLIIDSLDVINDGIDKYCIKDSQKQQSEISQSDKLIQRRICIREIYNMQHSKGIVHIKNSDLATFNQKYEKNKNII